MARRDEEKTEEEEDGVWEVAAKVPFICAAQRAGAVSCAAPNESHELKPSTGCAGQSGESKSALLGSFSLFVLFLSSQTAAVRALTAALP